MVTKGFLLWLLGPRNDMLGAGGQLVGQAETSERRTGVPVVTLGHQIDIEKALEVDPTLVLVDELIGPPEAIDALKQSGAVSSSPTFHSAWPRSLTRWVLRMMLPHSWARHLLFPIPHLQARDLQVPSICSVGRIRGRCAHQGCGGGG